MREGYFDMACTFRWTNFFLDGEEYKLNIVFCCLVPGYVKWQTDTDSNACRPSIHLCVYLYTRTYVSHKPVNIHKTWTQMHVTLNSKKRNTNRQQQLHLYQFYCLPNFIYLMRNCFSRLKLMLLSMYNHKLPHVLARYEGRLYSWWLKLCVWYGEILFHL